MRMSIGRRIIFAAILLSTIQLKFSWLEQRSHVVVLAAAEDMMNDIGNGLTTKIFDNTAFAGVPVYEKITPTPVMSLLDGSLPRSGELSGAITFSYPGVYNFSCTFTSTTTGWVFIDGHQVCNDGNAYRIAIGSFDNPLPIDRASKTLPFRARITSSGNNDQPASLSVSWKVIANGTAKFRYDDSDIGTDNNNLESNKNANEKNLRSSAFLSPSLPGPEKRRDDLQRSLSSSGWGNWLHHDVLSLVKLPEGIVVALRLCRKSISKCITRAIPDGYYGAETRVGAHAWDRSYVQMYVGPGYNKGDDTQHDYGETEHKLSKAFLKSSDDIVNANVSIQYSASGPQNQNLMLLITPISCDDTTNCSDYEIRLEGRYAWFRAGNVSIEHRISTNTDAANAISNATSLVFHSAGLGTVNISSTNTVVSSPSSINSSDSTNNSSTMILPLTEAGISVGVSTDGLTVLEIESVLSKREAQEIDKLQNTYGDKAPVAAAIQAAVMWTLIYNPVENGPFMPVSRAWSLLHEKEIANQDWTYTIFEWDNFFASLLAGLSDDPRIAYSNLFQVVKSKTAAGFVPNVAAGGQKSEDRTEPPVGSMATLQLYRKFQQMWIIEVVFDDLLDWHNWFFRTRIMEPAGLIALGSWNEEAVLAGGDSDPGNKMQNARWESGLDNSPMYDGEDFFDSNGTHLMELYDVGMSSMFVQDANALAELAEIIGRPESIMLRSRGKVMSERIRKHLWDPIGRIFTNKFRNNTFYRRISPTSFYSMQTGAPTDSQTTMMVNEWLLNSSRFCITPQGDFAGNDDTCYWGLPSISADDPAYPPLGYWRGFVWGPMAMLMYWSLLKYDHINEVQQGRKALCRQMEALMMEHWNNKRHICENYNPHRVAGDCSGTAFYHWGALNGLIGMMEDGYWMNSAEDYPKPA